MRLVSIIEHCPWSLFVLSILSAGLGIAGAQERPLYLDDTRPLDDAH